MNRLRTTLIFALTIGGIIAGISFLGVFKRVEQVSLDLRFRLRGTIATSPEIVFVEIDEQSIQRLGRWPWSRDVLAELVTALSEFGARHTVYDMFFSEKSPLSDFFLSQSMVVSDNVFLGLSLHVPEEGSVPEEQDTVPAPSLERFALPASGDLGVDVWQASGVSPLVRELYDAASGAGHVSVIEDCDGKIRWVPLVLQYKRRLYPSLGLTVAMRYLSVEDRDLHIYPGKYALLKNTPLGDVRIPLDDKCRMMVNWSGAWYESFSYCSVADVIEAFLHYTKGEEVTLPVRTGTGADNVVHVDPAVFLKDKICLVGLTTGGLADRKPVPVDTKYPLVGLHANVVNSILTGQFVKRGPTAVNLGVLFVLVVLIAVISAYLRPIKGALMVVLLIASFGSIACLVFIHAGIWIDVVAPLSGTLCVFLAVVIEKYVIEEKERRRYRNIFQRYMSKSVVDTILEDPEALKLGGNKRDITIMFCDIRGFTSLSESLMPEEVVGLLNNYFTVMVDKIFHHNGTLDKFIGDCIMAFWGAPAELDDHAFHAVQSAIDIQRELKRLNRDRTSETEPVIAVGIGINSGEAIVGNVGVIERGCEHTEYTAIGDHVNLASRLQDVATKGKIIISKHTYQQVKGRVPVIELPPVSVKGKSKLIHIYEVVWDGE